MREHIKEYKERLGKAMCEYMEAPVTERSAESIKHMCHTWKALNHMEKHMMPTDLLTCDDIKMWNAEMVNADGTHGGHWTVEQTKSVAEVNGVEFDHISEWEWNVTMNMMYSDYYKTASMMGVDMPNFYAGLARNFLFDADGGSPKHKLTAYYKYVVKGE